ncbi:MAG: exodeoxyribonuclease VII small subunit [Candidatus Omnitrophota bacterium]
MSEDVKFEKAMERLEKIVADLEAGNVSLEEALKRYEEGVELSRACQKKLAQAEQKIEVLTKTLNGALVREPFTPEEDGSGAEAKPKKGPKADKKKKQDEEDENNEDLLI